MAAYDYESRLARPIRMKVAEFARDNQLRHMIFSNQLDRDLLEHLGYIADIIRVLARDKQGGDFLSSLLSHKRAMLYFTQPSTRTFLSFAAACQILGITYDEVRDPSVSSEAKGESPLDSIRTFSSYFDVIIMRSRTPRLAETCAYLMNDLENFHQRNVPIINAGSGADQHPSQALLDIYTLQRTFQFAGTDELYRQHVVPVMAGQESSEPTPTLKELRQQPGMAELQTGLAGKTYGFCGDIGRGRTVRSLAQLLSLYEDVKFVFICPDHEKLKLNAELKRRLSESPNVKSLVELTSFEDLYEGKPVIEQLDALYMTRIQTEYDTAEDAETFAQIDFSNYKLSAELADRMKSYAPILHPFPRDAGFGEIPTDVDTNPRAMYFRQARNGMWIRAALMTMLFNVDRDLTRYYHRHFSEYSDYNEAIR